MNKLFLATLVVLSFAACGKKEELKTYAIDANSIETVDECIQRYTDLIKSDSIPISIFDYEAKKLKEHCDNVILRQIERNKFLENIKQGNY